MKENSLRKLFYIYMLNIDTFFYTQLYKLLQSTKERIDKIY